MRIIKPGFLKAEKLNHGKSDLYANDREKNHEVFIGRVVWSWFGADHGEWQPTDVHARNRIRVLLDYLARIQVK